MIALSFVICHFAFCFSACSETDDEATEEYSNWQQRNETFFASLEDSLSRGGASWKKIKSYSKDETTAGVNTDYIYVKVLENGTGTDVPLYTDSVRVSYRGRLIPTATYPEGLVFDQSYIGDFNMKTASVLDNTASGFKDGFTTAILHMHKGDRWRIYVPYQLGYGTIDNGTIPAYSVLIFDVVLIDFISGKGKFTPWTSRQASMQ